MVNGKPATLVRLNSCSCLEVQMCCPLHQGLCKFNHMHDEARSCVFAEGPLLSVDLNVRFEASAVQGSNQLNVTFIDERGDSSLGLAPYNCSVIFEASAPRSTQCILLRQRCLQRTATWCARHANCCTGRRTRAVGRYCIPSIAPELHLPALPNPLGGTHTCRWMPPSTSSSRGRR